MIAVYRNGKYEIMMHQYSMVSSIIKVLENAKMGLDIVQASSMVALCSLNDLNNLLNSRLYFKFLHKNQGGK